MKRKKIFLQNSKKKVKKILINNENNNESLKEISNSNISPFDMSYFISNSNASNFSFENSHALSSEIVLSDGLNNLINEPVLNSTANSILNSTTNSILVTELEDISKKTDDFTFLASFNVTNIQNIDLEQRKTIIKNFFRRSRSAWFLRGQIFIPDNSRDQVITKILDDLFKYLKKDFPFPDEDLSEAEANIYSEILPYISKPEAVCREILEKEYSKMDRNIRIAVRNWVKILNIDVQKFQNPECKIWNFNHSIENAKKVSLKFEYVQETNFKTLFPIFSCIIALFTSPEEAILDKYKLFKVINKLFKGDKVKKKTLFSLVTTPFMAVVGAILESLSENPKLPKGRQVARENSKSVIGKAAKIAIFWSNNQHLIPEEFVGIEIEDILQLIIKKLTSKKQKQKNIIREIFIQEICPNIDDI